MKVEGAYYIKAQAEHIWTILQDPRAIAKCIPGCESLEPAGANRYQATIRVGVAAIKGTYWALVKLADLRPPHEYRMQVEGQGGAGFVKGEAHIRLLPQKEGTKVTVLGEAQLGGGLATVGQRLGGSVAKVLIGDFFKRVKRLAEAKERAADSGQR